MKHTLKLASVGFAVIACGAGADSPESEREPSASPPSVSATQRSSAPEGWTGTFGGQAAGTYGGPIAIATVVEDAVARVVLYTDDGGPVHINVTIEPLSAPIGPGAGGPASATVMFADSPDFYTSIQNGTASELQSGTADDERTPDPPTLTVTAITPQEVSGELTGTLWQSQPTGDRSDTSPASVQFTARACRYGMPEFTACTNPKSAWP